MITTVIRQSGHLQCPICKNSFGWAYHLELSAYPEWGREDMVSTSVNSPNHASHIITEHGKVRFLVPCPRCRCFLETDEMEMDNSQTSESAF